MFLVISGTKEAKDIVNLCKEKNWDVLVLAVAKYGRETTWYDEIDSVLVKKMSEGALKKVLSEYEVKAVVDASHPFAGKDVQLVGQVCRQLNINYIRYERKETNLPDNDLVHWVENMEEAAEKAYSLGKTVFLTTGSHQLEYFAQRKETKESRVVVRVLPEHIIIKKCQDMGFLPKDIIAAQGPFSTKFNREMFKFYKADVIVTKESGVASGTDTKVAAALEIGIPVVVIKRESGKGGVNRVSAYEDVLTFLKSLI